MHTGVKIPSFGYLLPSVLVLQEILLQFRILISDFVNPARCNFKLSKPVKNQNFFFRKKVQFAVKN
jgi:hypothetical protein